MCKKYLVSYLEPYRNVPHTMNHYNMVSWCNTSLPTYFHEAYKNFIYDEYFRARFKG